MKSLLEKLTWVLKKNSQCVYFQMFVAILILLGPDPLPSDMDLAVMAGLSVLDHHPPLATPTRAPCEE